MEAGIVIVGGGAAGLLAAASAAARLREAGSDAPVVVLEAAREPGRKILVSGGGHCNVLPLSEARARFVSSSPRRLVDRYLDRFPLSGQRAFFEEILGGPLREEPDSAKLYPPSNRARDVRDALVVHARAAGAEVRASMPVREVSLGEGGGFDVRLDGDSLSASRVVLATGGRSVLAGGADAAGFDWAASSATRFGLSAPPSFRSRAHRPPTRRSPGSLSRSPSLPRAAASRSRPAAGSSSPTRAGAARPSSTCRTSPRGHSPKAGPSS
ncbi:MAG: NAD(P)/FAD-dependent oxidoreductase [Holophagales bacterium]|nr:NAD(P)/FAD-dependent oxidoreductase [Holophagales bacterium]